MKRWLARHPIIRLLIGILLLLLAIGPFLIPRICVGVLASIREYFCDLQEAFNYLWRVTFPRKG